MKKLILAAVFALTLATGFFVTANEVDAARGRGSDHPRHGGYRRYDDSRHHNYYKRYNDDYRRYRYYRHY